MRRIALHKVPGEGPSNLVLRAQAHLPDVDVTLTCARLAFLRKLMCMQIPRMIALVQATHGVAHGWGKLVESDWAWLRLHGDPTLPDFRDAESVAFILQSFTRKQWAAMIKRTRARVVGPQRIKADVHTLVILHNPRQWKR